MATTTASGTGTRNNKSTVLHGNASGSNGVFNVSLTTSAVQSFGTGPVVSATLGNQRAIAGREFAKTRAGQFIIIGAKSENKIAGVVDNTLRSPADHIKAAAVAKVETTKTGFLRGLAWTSLNVDLPSYTLTQSAQTVAMGTDTSTTAPRLAYIAAGNPDTISYRAY